MKDEDVASNALQVTEDKLKYNQHKDWFMPIEPGQIVKNLIPTEPSRFPPLGIIDFL